MFWIVLGACVLGGALRVPASILQLAAVLPPKFDGNAPGMMARSLTVSALISDRESLSFESAQRLSPQTP